jgi:hypothetical protein
VTPEDLKRYTEYYSRRIRTFAYGERSVHNQVFFSIEALQTLQLATQGTPGALSPLLTTFVWPLEDLVDPYLDTDSLKQLAPYMFLFLGEQVTSLSFTTNRKLGPVYIASIHSASLQLSKLKSLTVRDRFTPPSIFSIDYLARRAWNTLEEVDIAYVSSPALVPLLATLPLLRRITLNMVEVPLPNHPPTNQEPFFPSLKEIDLSFDGLDPFLKLMLYVPLKNRTTMLHFLSHSQLSLPDAQKVVSTIARHTHPLTLESLECVASSRITNESEADLDIEDVNASVDIFPLFDFAKLTELRLILPDALQVTPLILSRIPHAYPKLQRLQMLGLSLPFYVPTRITHEHVLDLLDGCPNLLSLALQFDTERVTGQECKGKAYGLQDWGVYDSPIYSPSRVLSFIQAGFPHLVWLTSSHLEPHGAFKRRWDAVIDGLSLLHVL